MILKVCYHDVQDMISLQNDSLIIHVLRKCVVWPLCMALSLIFALCVYVCVCLCVCVCLYIVCVCVCVHVCLCACVWCVHMHAQVLCFWGILNFVKIQWLSRRKKPKHCIAASLFSKNLIFKGYLNIRDSMFYLDKFQDNVRAKSTFEYNWSKDTFWDSQC